MNFFSKVNKIFTNSYNAWLISLKIADKKVLKWHVDVADRKHLETYS